MLYRGLVLLSSVSLLSPAHAQQQQDTTKHGWGIVYSSPRSRASASNVNATPAPATPAPATPTTATQATPAPGITAVTAPPKPGQPQVTTLPTIRGTPSVTPSVTPAVTPPPANGVYMGDRPAAAAAPAVAASGTYDTLPPAPAYASNSGGNNDGVHLDELMSLHEYTATGLTNLKPAEVQQLEVWLAGYRLALMDSATRAAQQRTTTSQQFTPAPPASAAIAAANTRAVPAVNAHTVTGIRSGSRYIQIDDGSVWDIHPADQSETANWQVGDNVTVRVASQPYGEFDHELVNNQRTGPVRAKFMGYARGQ